MQIKIFSIPIGVDEGMTEEMNHFLRANKVIGANYSFVKSKSLFEGRSYVNFVCQGTL